MNSVRKQVYIPVELDRTLKRVCIVESLSESEVLRRALEVYFTSRSIDSDHDPILLTIGLAGDEGPGTGSTSHDDIYER